MVRLRQQLAVALLTASLCRTASSAITSPLPQQWYPGGPYSQHDVQSRATCHAHNSSAMNLRGGGAAFAPSPAVPAVKPNSNDSPAVAKPQAEKVFSRLHTGTLSQFKDAQRQGLRFLWPFRWLFGSDKKKKSAFDDPRFSVMIQGFDWAAMSNKKAMYNALTDEIPRLHQAGVNVVWFPPPSASADAQGYLPGKWYSIPHKSHLRRAVHAARSLGMVPMVDVVLNHRTATRVSQSTNDWTLFEEPSWGEWAVVRDDWKCAPHHDTKFCPDNATCGTFDTGDNACYAPDIDHHNEQVQKDIIAWMRWLKKDLGFAAYRFDNIKGYAGNFTAKYIEATNPVLSVGEYFDTNHDLLTGWIAKSKGLSKMFDFGQRYKLRDAIREDTYGHLLDTFFGPMLWYDADHSVSFLDNHDTAGELNDRFGNNFQIAMGYAFILTHPSIPCVFWNDWNSEIQDTIRDLLEVRQAAGINPMSKWKVDRAENGLYAGFIGENLAMKMGSREWSPNSRCSSRDWERVAEGHRWAVWLRKDPKEGSGDQVDQVMRLSGGGASILNL